MNYAKRVVDAIGGQRMVDLRGAPGYVAATSEPPTIPGAIDVSALLAGGVIILLSRGEVVHIAKARTQLYAKIATLRSRPAIMAVPVFDQILVRPAHPDQIDSVYAALRAEFLPEAAPVVAPVRIERRI